MGGWSWRVYENEEVEIMINFWLGSEYPHIQVEINPKTGDKAFDQYEWGNTLTQWCPDEYKQKIYKLLERASKRHHPEQVKARPPTKDTCYSCSNGIHSPHDRGIECGLTIGVPVREGEAFYLCGCKE